MNPVEIERRIDKQFTTVTGGRRGALERHQTLRAAIDWSYDLLTPEAQTVLRRLSVCVGGFDLDAALALAEGIEADGFDLVRELVAKSLVERYEANANTRYRLLEMIRQHAAERLDRGGEAPAIRDRHAAHYADHLVTLFAEVRSDDEFEVLELIAVETPNIAAGLRWWLATDRAADVLARFDRMPYVDAFALPSIALIELTEVANAALGAPGIEQLQSFSPAYEFVQTLAFMAGDIDDYRRIQEAARAAGPTIASELANTMVAMFDGHTGPAVEHGQLAVDLVRAEGDDARLAWHLATLSMMANIEAHSSGAVNTTAIRCADEALAIARRVPGNIARFYPLVAMVEAYRTTDPQRALGAAAEVTALDRTQRRWWATIAVNSAANTRASVGDAIGQLTEWRTGFVEFDQLDERFMFAMLLATVSDHVVSIDPTAAIELAAIAESGVIAPGPTFAVKPALTRLAEERPDDITAARARAAPLSYREAVDRVIERIDVLLAEHSPSDDD